MSHLALRVTAGRGLDMTDMGRHWIDGAWHEFELVADSYNPATGELLGRFADGGEAEARAAVSAARPAFAGTDWGRDRALRSWALLELAERFEARAPELALMLTRENGKTLAEATGEVGAAAEVAPGHYFSSLAEPVGVVAIIVPWNAPVALSSVHSAPRSPPGTPSRQSSPGRPGSPMRSSPTLCRTCGHCLPVLSTCSPSRATPVRRSSSNPPMSTWSASPPAFRSAARSRPLAL